VALTTLTVSHNYSQADNYTARVTATADNGCITDPIIIPLTMVKAVAEAGRDTLIIPNEPFQLHGAGGGEYSWSPAVGLDNPSVPDPITVLQDDQTYRLTVTTEEGCVATDIISITVFKGSNIYVPTGFTPNRDGRNDGLKPFYVGIKNLGYFMVYNRWGQ